MEREGGKHPSPFQTSDGVPEPSLTNKRLRAAQARWGCSLRDGRQAGQSENVLFEASDNLNATKVQKGGGDGRCEQDKTRQGDKAKRVMLMCWHMETLHGPEMRDSETTLQCHKPSNLSDALGALCSHVSYTLQSHWA